jgi:hypothetical protein
MKTSVFVVFGAAAYLAAGACSVSGADIGESCCGDLEERVAELEAMAATTGNRKVSLHIFGHVGRIILNWNDGFKSNTYYGLESGNLLSRFGFRGEGKITPSLKVGFEILINMRGPTSGGVSQLDEDGRVASQIAGTIAPPASFNAANTDPPISDARRVAWWIEHADLGRLTVGRWDGAGVWGILDLTLQLYSVASPSFVLLNGGFFIRGPTGQFYSMVWGNVGDPAAGFGRAEVARYDSPSYRGFILSASIAEAGDYGGSMVRYADERGGFRLAGYAGLEKVYDRFTPVTLDPTASQFTGPRPNLTVWGTAFSAMHISTGLFAQGQYAHIDYGTPGQQGFSGYWGQSTNNSQKPETYWLVQGGMSRNWFGYGNTTAYGEFGKSIDAGAAYSGRNFNGSPGAVGCPGPNAVCVPTLNNFVSVNGVTDTELTVKGFGVAQNFSTASTDLYLGYRHFGADIVCTGATTAAGACAGAAGGAAKKLPTHGLDVIVMGSRVNF